MANLDLIKHFNEKYDKDSPIRSLKKSFSFGDSINVQNNLRELGWQYTTYFEEGLSAKVVLLFIDICSFSSRYGHLKGNELSKYFDEYYNIIVPIIYKFNGEVEKIIGDGIICVFGKPFLNESFSRCLDLADQCAKEIIRSTYFEEKFISKVGFHYGEINYFKNKSGHYNELTMIGKPLTELFRLESISEDQKINYLVIYKSITEWNWNFDINSQSPFWKLEAIKDIQSDLTGIDYKYYQTNKYTWPSTISSIL